MNPTAPIEWLDAGAASIYLLFGVIHLDLWLRRTLESTIAAADGALYRAKEAGRNRVLVEAKE